MRAAVALVVLLAACASPSPDSSLPSGLKSAEASASLLSPSATPQPVVIDTIAEVVTNDLVVRSAPGVDPSSEILPSLLQPGDRLFVIEGPVHATFYDWYHVQPITEPPPWPQDWPAAGWVAAASREGEPWVAPLPIDCPQPADLEVAELAAFHPLEALSCFGSRGLRVRAASIICSGYFIEDLPLPNYTIEPEWLGSGTGCQLNPITTAVAGAALPYFTPEFVPGGSTPEHPFWLWVIGQFDHSAASSCVLHPQSGDPRQAPAPELDSAQIILLCRSHFAVTATEAADPPNE
jgi:hypothetical protein